MNVAEVGDLLGRSADDPRIEDLLIRFGIAERPRLPPGDEAASGVWLLNAAEGIEFGFEDEADFLGLGRGERDAGPLLLTQLYLYGRHANVVPYRGRLPFGLAYTDDRNAVRAKLAAHEAQRRSYVRDAWALEPFTLIVGYADADSAIDFLLFLLAPPRSPALPGDEVPLPSITAIVSSFGEPLSGPAVALTFKALGWASKAEAIRRGGLVSLRRAYGIDLVGRPASTMHARPAATGAANALTEAVFFRDRVSGARGWRGELPFGLQWDDSPEVVKSRVAYPADASSEGDFAGWILWHRSQYSVQVHYSTMENFIVRIRLLAPGVWAAMSGT